MIGGFTRFPSTLPHKTLNWFDPRSILGNQTVKSVFHINSKGFEMLLNKQFLLVLPVRAQVRVCQNCATHSFAVPKLVEALQKATTREVRQTLIKSYLHPFIFTSIFIEPPQEATFRELAPVLPASNLKVLPSTLTEPDFTYWYYISQFIVFYYSNVFLNLLI